jgi:HemY protein
VKQNPDHAESHRIGADAALTARVWGDARQHLERLIELEQAGDGVSADTCRRMARLEAGEHGAGSSGERQWLDMASEARAGNDWVCETCGTLGTGGMEAMGWQLCCPRCDAIDSLAWRAAGGAARHGGALGGIVLEQLPAAETPAPAAPQAAAPSQPATATPLPGPIPHGSHNEPASAASDAQSGKPAPLGASVDAARLVN